MGFEQTISTHESSIRLLAFFGIFIIMALWEIVAPCRVLIVSKLTRWINNFAIVFLNTIILRLVFPAAAVGMTHFVEQHSWGLFNYFQLPLWVTVLLSIVALDFIIYLQHVLVHAVPGLWRLHRVHHADLDFDVTTGARFHPIEIILSMIIKFAAIAVIGPSVIAVIIFEIVLNATSMFNHSNVKLPTHIDKVLRLFVVTPDMHRVHHSIEADETNSNFGFNLPWWDLLFGTYRQQPRAGHQGMVIGIHDYRDDKLVNRLPGMLRLPFIGKITDYAINRRSWDKKDD